MNIHRTLAIALITSILSSVFAEPGRPSPAPPVQSLPADEDEDDHYEPVTHMPRRIDPDRPHVSEAPVVVGTGVVQIETGVLGVSARGSGEGFCVTAPSLVRYGTSPETEFRVELDLLNFQEKRLGFGDVSLGLKHVIADEGPELAILYRYKLNAGSNGFQSAPEPEVKLLLGFDLGDKTEVEVNVGARSTINPEGTDRFIQGTFALAVTQSLVSHKLAIYGEIFGDAPYRPGGGGVLTAQSGFLYRLSDDTQLDMEVYRGLSAMGIDWGYGLGMSTRF